MARNRMKYFIIIWMCLVGIYSTSREVYAEDYSYLTDTVPVILDDSGLDKKGTTKITWYPSITLPEDDTVTITYEAEISKNKNFINAQKYTTSGELLVLDKSVFGKNGGKFYARVRICVDVVGDNPMSEVGAWSETKEMTFVKINETNFPGMYKVLKNGSKKSGFDGLEKVTYDQNGDGWLDPQEINDIWILATADERKTVNGVFKLKKATDISSFKGIEYLPKIASISIERFSGKQADLSKCNAFTVDISGVSAKQITVNAPNARSVSIQADEKTKITKIDLSKCKNAVEILAYGNNGTKTLKLPKSKKKLKILSLSEYGFKSLNLNSYTKLQQVYFYSCDIKSVKVNKCKNLRYIYFYYCDKIKSLDLKSNKKLRGADFYQSTGLTKTTVKRPKNGKYTWNTGKWWYSSSKYKKDMEKIYQ